MLPKYEKRLTPARILPYIIGFWLALNILAKYPQIAVARVPDKVKNPIFVAKAAPYLFAGVTFWIKVRHGLAQHSPNKYFITRHMNDI